MAVLSPRDWSAVAAEYQASAPGSMVVLDKFLDESFAEDFRNALLNHYGWRVKSWVARNLHNGRPDLPHYSLIAEELAAALPQVMDGYEVMSHWALMYQGTATVGNVHADATGMTLTLWLTPDEFNLDPETGGLVVYDVMRPDTAAVHDGLDGDWAEAYVQENTAGQAAWRKVRYGFNRALLFNGMSFHRSDRIDFDFDKPGSARINAAMSFDRPERWRETMSQYGLRAGHA